MSKRPLVPSFIQKIDDKLLRNKPGAWASRMHLVLYFVAAFALLLFVFCYAVFFDAKQYSSIESWNVFIGLVAFVGFVFWLIYLLRFNVFKRYGNWSAMDGLRDFALYFISIGAMVAVCFVPSAIETMRANQQFGHEEIVKDINEININASRLEYNILPLEWRTDTCKVVEKKYTTTVPEAPPEPYVEVVPDTVVSVVADTVIDEEPVYVPDYTYLDTSELRTKLENADSLLKINDSLYVFYECPNYRFVSSYSADEYSEVKMLSSADIYNRVIKNYKQPDRTALLKRMEELKTKYAVNGKYYRGNYDRIDENDNYEVKIDKKYDLARISNGIDNAVRKKQAWINEWHIYLRVFYYITLVLTMLVFIFRHSTVKTFFLSVLTAVLLAIITGLLTLISQGDEVSVLSFMIVYYVLFALLALSIFKTKIRNVVQGISLNLFLFATPFAPLVFVALKEARYYSDSLKVYEERDPVQIALYFLIAEIVGSVILVILIQPLFKKLYRRWYSAPEE
jgi:hypothetical protein